MWRHMSYGMRGGFKFAQTVSVQYAPVPSRQEHMQ